MKKSFTLIELIFMIVILGILLSVALIKFKSISTQAHESNLIAFVKTLNRTTGEDLWARSINQGLNGSIRNLENSENYLFLSKYIAIPNEINKSSINLSNCGINQYNTVMTSKIDNEEYNITCKDGTSISSPYFQLIRIKDNKILVSR